MKRLYEACVFLWLVSMLASCSFSTIKTDEAYVLPQTSGVAVESETLQSQMPDRTEPIETTVETIPTLPPLPESDDIFVRVADYIPDCVIDLKYAGTDNFTGAVIYDSDEAWLRYGTVKKLMQVQLELKEMGYGVKLWDGFRPPSAQFKLWEICPDPTYVSNPNNGFSNHSRGNTVDITLVDESGNEIEMPTGFDDFSALADRNYSDCTEVAASNAQMLEEIMTKHGFKGYHGEWWHYTDMDTYEVEHDFVP